jgi:hypothetical protein
MGLFLSTEFQRSTTFFSFLRFLGSYFAFDPCREHFFVPTTHVHRRRAQNGGQGRRLLSAAGGLSLTAVSTAGSCDDRVLLD